MKQNICPICGSKNTLREEMIPYRLQYGTVSKTIQINNYVCSSCGEEGDFFSENDNAIKDCMESLKQEYAALLLDEFEKEKIKFTSIERSFALPPRTLSKWKAGAKKPSSAAIALLRLVSVFPWLTDVAECSYEEQRAYEILGNAFLHRFSAGTISGAYKETNDQKYLLVVSKPEKITSAGNDVFSPFSLKYNTLVKEGSL